METKPGNYSDLAGKTAVVTSGSHGVGSGICRELGRQGVQVVVNGRERRTGHAVTRPNCSSCHAVRRVNI